MSRDTFRKTSDSTMENTSSHAEGSPEMPIDDGDTMLDYEAIEEEAADTAKAKAQADSNEVSRQLAFEMEGVDTTVGCPPRQPAIPASSSASHHQGTPDLAVEEVRRELGDLTARPAERTPTPRLKPTQSTSLYFSSIMESVQRSNAGIIPGSTNRFAALGQDTQTSRPTPTMEDAIALFENLRARKTKRVRTTSTESLRQHKNARIDPEDELMDEDASPAPPPFEFRQIIDQSSNAQCFIKAGDSPYIGACWGKIPNYRVAVSVAGGRFGQPMIKVSFLISKAWDGKPLDSANKDQAKNRDANHELIYRWQPGLIVDTANPQYQIENFKAFPFTAKPVEEDDPPIDLLGADERTKERLMCMSFIGSGVSFEGSNRHNLSGSVSQEVMQVLDYMTTKPCKIVVWYIAPGNPADYERQTIRHFRNAFERRLEPFHQYLDSTTGMPNITLDMPPIRHFGGGMYCQYPTVGKLKDETQEPVGYIALPEKKYFYSAKEFQIYYQTAIVREYQWQRGQMAHLVLRPHRVFLMKTFRLSDPVQSQAGKPKLTKVQQAFRNSFYAYIRMTANELGSKESVPPEGTVFKLDWLNEEAGNGQHLRTPHREQWHGKVCRVNPELIGRARADFCILVQRPFSAKFVRSYDTVVAIEDLPYAYLTPQYNTTPALRELEAVSEYCNSYRDDLNLIRLSGVSDPLKSKVYEVDLRRGPDNDDRKIVRYNTTLAAQEGRFNPKQQMVMHSTEKVINKTALVEGPPGSGKTQTIAELVNQLTLVGHKVLITAPSNGATDQNAEKIWTSLPKNKKSLRLTIPASDWATVLRTREDAFADLQTPFTPQSTNAKAWEQDPMFAQMMVELSVAEVAVEHSAAEADHTERILDDAARLQEDYRVLYDHTETMHTFPRGMSMAYRIWQMTTEDLRVFLEEEYDDTAMNRAIARADGTAPPRTDPSMKFRSLMQRYNANDSSLRREEYGQFKDEYDIQVRRVLEDTDVLLTTCNNSGSKTVSEVFKPSVLIIDEAGQATVPTTAVPMAFYEDWLAVYLVGDQKQLQPVVTSRASNEFAENLQLSYFSLLLAKQVDSIILDKQYRMCEQISLFPAAYFYDGHLHDASIVKEDNPIRQAMRRVSLQQYGIKGPDGDGCEYWMIDVARGVARVEEHGTSLQNYAHASVISTAMRRLIVDGIPKSAISVLTFYKGQIRTIYRTADEVEELKDVKSVSTVDGYQGQEAPVIILDLVAAANPASAMSEEASAVYEGITQHVRNPNRLCVALTRAKFGLIVVCNVKTLGKAPTGHNAARALGALLMDASNRGLLHIDTTTPDTHPISVAKRAQDAHYRKAVEAEAAELTRYSFVNDLVQKKHLTLKKATQRPAQTLLTHRTGTVAPTTRPHISKTILDAIRPESSSKYAKEQAPPGWVDKGKKAVYDSNLRWTQPPPAKPDTTTPKANTSAPSGPSGQIQAEKGPSGQGKSTEDKPSGSEPAKPKKKNYSRGGYRGKHPRPRNERSDRGGGGSSVTDPGSSATPKTS
ncbi:MAG: hypothetical protein M1830_008075 [Pleopsidium flavum]|nr:MAG: hypothetical protein M1830_008075 [Pleopsidium flavum]